MVFQTRYYCVIHFCRDKDIPKDPNGIHAQTREATVHIVRLVRLYIYIENELFPTTTN